MKTDRRSLPSLPALPVLAALLALVLAVLPACTDGRAMSGDGPADDIPDTAIDALASADDLPDSVIQALASAEVWERELEQALRSHIETLAASGEARALAAAALLLLPDHEGDDAGAADAAQRQAWLAAALQADSGDPVVLWLAARGLPGSMAEPGQRAAALAKLARVDPDNAAVWLDRLTQALAEDDAAGIDENLQRAAGAAHFDAYDLAVSQLLQEALAGFQAPPMPDDVRQAVAAHAGPGEAEAWLDHPVEGRILFLTSVIGMNAPLPFNTVCKSSADAALPTPRRSACLAIATVVADGARLVGIRQLALTMRLQLAGDKVTPAQLERWRQEYRDALWQIEQGIAVRQGQDGQQLSQDHFRHALDEGEYAAWLHELEANGIPATAPEGWLPEPAHVRALLGVENVD